MRKLAGLSVLAVLAASPAVGQMMNSFQLDDLRAQQQSAERRAIDQANQLQAMETRLRADQASADLAIQRQGVRLPRLPYAEPLTPSASTASPRYPSMPDAALADSNARVRDAARNRR